MTLIQISEPISNKNHNSLEQAVGIDLGTTNSVIATKINNQIEILGPIIPSIYRTISSAKRLMGTGQNIDIDGISISPVQVSAYILSSLKNQAEEILKTEITKAVITVPAHFDDTARNDTKLAANMAGLEVLRLINEPTAAAVAYGIKAQAEGIYLIYDFGGGTFDVSILRMQKSVFQVIATDGDINLGGDDIDAAIVKFLNLATEEYFIAREAKEYLSLHEDWTNGKYFLTRTELNEIITPFINKTIEICKSAIKASKIDPALIKEIILVGGSTRIPMVKQALTNFLKKPLDNIDPDLVVAMGAAIQADTLTHGSENLLLDVNSLSIGLEVMGGMNERIIHKNSPIPASITKYFTTYQDGQTGLTFNIVQGEREMAKDCRSLAKFELKGIPPMRAAAAKVAVTFNLDADGLLTISAKEETTGIKQSIEVNPTYGLSKEEAEKMLESAYLNAKQDLKAKNLVKAKLKAQDNIINIQKAITEDKEYIDLEEAEIILTYIHKLEALLSSDNLEEIEQANMNLEHVSSSFIQSYLNRKIKKLLQGKSTERLKS